MGIEPFGQGELFARAWEANRNENMRVEAFSFGQNIQTAHALDATFLPHGKGNDFVNSWIEPMKLMGDRLNFYRSFNDHKAATWAQNERLKINNELQILPPVPLFKFNKNTPIQDIVNFTSTSSRKKGRSLIGRLSNLPIEERHAEIEKIQSELYRFQRHNESNQLRRVWLESGTDIAATILGLGLGPFMSGVTILAQIMKVAKKSPTLDLLITEIEQTLMPSKGQNQKLEFLDSINRVAHLKDD